MKRYCIFLLLFSLSCQSQNDKDLVVDIFYQALSNHNFSDRRPTKVSFGHIPSESLLKTLLKYNFIDEKLYDMVLLTKTRTISLNPKIRNELQSYNSRKLLVKGQHYTEVDFSRPYQVSNGKIIVFESVLSKTYGEKRKATGMEIMQTYILNDENKWILLERKILETY